MAPRRPRPPPASTSNPTSSASSSSFFPPSSVSQLKYALFSWPNNPVTKRDPIAQTYFKSSCQMSNFASTLGGSFPLQLYQGSLGPGKPVELFLSGEQCQILMNGLIEKMGPTRAKQTWKKDAIHYLSELKDLKPILYKDQQAIEKHFVELKDQNDRYETKGRFESLIRMQEILEVIRRDLGEGQVDGEARFIAIDIETWERNHDKVTEVGFAKSVWKKGQFEEMEVKHFVVQENADLRNGRFCPDARDHFHFGTTETLPTDNLVSYLSSELLTPLCPIFLLFHDSRSDTKSLQLLGLSTAMYLNASPLPHPKNESRYASTEMGEGRWIVDTQILYSGWNRKKKQAKLGDVVQELGISLSDPKGELEGLGGYQRRGIGEKAEKDELKFHNSGNDAWATLLAFWKLMDVKLEREEE